MKAVMVGRKGGRVGDLQRATLDGLKRHGVEIEWLVDMRHCRNPQVPIAADFLLCWGWHRGARLRDLGYNVLVGELGYIGDRSHWTSLGWNGLNGRADFCLGGAPLPDRFARHFEMRPWKEGGDFILLTQQVPGDASLQGRHLKPWYREIAEEAERAYGLPVRFRPHPRAIARRLWQEGDRELAGLTLVDDVTAPIQDDLARAAMVVTWNSNSAVDAVLAGAPALTFDPGAMAYPVTGHAVGEIARPDRTEWANRLAWCQWSPDELAAGVWWERMKAGLQ